MDESLHGDPMKTAAWTPFKPQPAAGSAVMPDQKIAEKQTVELYDQAAHAMRAGEYQKACALFLAILAADALGRRLNHGGFYGG